MSYYTAGGFFGNLFKAIGKIAQPVYKAVVKPLIGSVVKSVPVLNTASTILAHVDPTNPHGIVGSRLQGRPPPAPGGAYGPPAASGIGRMAELYNPAAAPAGFPMEGSQGGATWAQQHYGPAAGYGRAYGRRSYRRRSYRRRRRY